MRLKSSDGEKEGERIVVGEDVSGSYVRPDEKARQESG